MTWRAPSFQIDLLLHASLCQHAFIYLPYLCVDPLCCNTFHSLFAGCYLLLSVQVPATVKPLNHMALKCTSVSMLP